ncbi:MAG: dihydroorotate dehydrogenase electron transfer subunit [Candidatus Neomarinimicrobiota bacterium]
MRIEEARVVSNRDIARAIWKMEVESPLVVQEVCGPGQFINIVVSETWDLPLRRPMSIAGTDGDCLKIIYKVLGEGTRRLSQKVTGEHLNILGPLGNWFHVGNKDGGIPTLVGGGVGIAPILWLHHVLESENREHAFIMGAATAEEHFLNHGPEKGIHITTDDGSAGERGTVMPTLKRLCQKRHQYTIFACGPEPMLKAIHRFSIRNKIPCQMALESYMACGTEICQGCVIEMKNPNSGEHSYHETYSLVCGDGPVYNAEEVKL